jgi:hypothetical protein
MSVLREIVNPDPAVYDDARRPVRPITAHRGDALSRRVATSSDDRNAGMGWAAEATGQEPFLILSTQGGCAPTVVL